MISAFHRYLFLTTLAVSTVLATTSSAVARAKQSSTTHPKEKKSMKLTSPSFKNQANIPVKYSCDHDNISPELIWDDVPKGTKSFAIISDDPDAPAGTWTHWLVYNIPGQVRHMPEYMPAQEALKDGTLQGLNDFRRIGYGGACPPEGHGQHHYHFKIYALDTVLDLKPGATKEQLEEAIRPHILDWAQLIGLYERPQKPH